MEALSKILEQQASELTGDSKKILNVIKHIQRQIREGIEPLELICDACKRSSNKDKTYTVLYRCDIQGELCLCDRCYHEYLQTLKKPEIDITSYLAQCGIKKEDLNFSFETFTKHSSQVQQIKDYANSNKLKDLLLVGDTGIGKTHLAISIMRQLIERGSDHKLMYYIIENNLHVAALEAQQEGYHDFMKRYHDNYELLVIDEFGQNPDITTAKALRIVNLIDHRQRTGRTTILISNRDREQLQIYGDAFYSRSELFLFIDLNESKFSDYRITLNPNKKGK